MKTCDEPLVLQSGHYWTSFHHTTGTSVFNPGHQQALGWVTQIYTTGPKYSYWVKRNSDGTNSCGTGGSATVLIYNNTTNYPTSLSVNLTVAGLATPVITALSANQIFSTSFFLPAFTEPASSITNIGTASHVGSGFVETSIKKPN